MRYRPEVDGLRAVAVVPVILFHAGFEAFGGGYVGVDIFFVISGYLITTIILSELEQEKFSLLNFYERRARRIMPALFLVIAVCVPFAWAWLLPRDLDDFAQSVAAVAVFSSNILFWRESGYFATEAELKPLLHTWSLAVEEHYYIIFPLVLMGLWRFGRRAIVWLLAVAFIVSLAGAHWGTKEGIAASFYLLPTRAWELLIGSFAAFYLLYKGRPQLSPRLLNLLGGLGLTMILVSIFGYRPETPVPSLYTLLPTVGAALIILFAHERSLAQRLLSHPWLVGIGLISYSAYLWHQPLLAFAKYRSPEEPTLIFMAALCLLTFPLAYLSWRFVEQPFRHKQAFDRRFIFTGTATGGVALIVFGLAISSRYEPELQRYGVLSKHQYELPQKTAEVVVWGDSYADAFAPRLGEALNAQQISMRAYIKHSCPSLLHVLRNEEARMGAGFAEQCRRFNIQALAEILELRPRYAVISSSYQRYLTHNNYLGEPILISELDPAAAPAQFLAQEVMWVYATLTNAGITPVFVGPHASLENLDRKLRSGAYMTQAMQVDMAGAVAATEQIFAPLLQARADALLVKSYEIFCDPAAADCRAFDQDPRQSYLFYDGGHLSSLGADRLVPQVMARMTWRKPNAVSLSR